MTSDMTRKLLLAGAAVAMLSVAACAKKPADTTNTTDATNSAMAPAADATANTAAMDSSNTMAPANTTK
jgi:uncharacterized lipoprotein YajG